MTAVYHPTQEATGQWAVDVIPLADLPHRWEFLPTRHGLISFLTLQILRWVLMLIVVKTRGLRMTTSASRRGIVPCPASIEPANARYWAWATVDHVSKTVKLEMAWPAGKDFATVFLTLIKAAIVSTVCVSKTRVVNPWEYLKEEGVSRVKLVFQATASFAIRIYVRTTKSVYASTHWK